jgi:hypothetical protein
VTTAHLLAILQPETFPLSRKKVADSNAQVGIVVFGWVKEFGLGFCV